MKYYLHDSNSFQDERITKLYIKYGYEGLGLFYTLLEKLAAQEKPIENEVLKMQLNVGKRLEKVWNYMHEIELISSKNGETFNENLLNFSEKYQIKKEKTRKKVAEWRKNQDDKKDVTDYKTVSNPDKIKLSKVKESKFKEQLQPFIDKYSKETLDEFFEYWTEPNKSGTKLRWEMESTWDIGRRLSRWDSNKFGKKDNEKVSYKKKELPDNYWK